VRTFTLVFLIVVFAVAVTATSGVALLEGSGVVTGSEHEQRVLGLHHLSLKDGVTPEDFERFVAEEWSPVFSGLFPGIRIMVAKGDRGAGVGDYLLVYDIQSMYVRKWYWPVAGGEGTEAATALRETCGNACSDAIDKFYSMAENTGYTDYVELVRD
jgi:hypothetical protein